MSTPSRPRSAFSLIELLAVLVAVVALVGIVLPRFQAYRRKAQVAAMVADLRELAAAEDSFWKSMRLYTTDTRVLDLTPSTGITLTVHGADSTGWSARATHPGDPVACSIFYGSAPPLPPAVEANVIGCEGEGEGEKGSREQRAESRKQGSGGRVQGAGFRVQERLQRSSSPRKRGSRLLERTWIAASRGDDATPR